MIRFCVPLIALMLAFSGVANAKLVGRWDPAAYAQGKFKVQKTAVIRKAPAPKKIHAQKNVLSSRLTTRASSFKKRLSWQKTKLLS